MKIAKTILGILLVLPLILSVIIPILEMMAGLSHYSRWLWEGVLFPVTDFMHGSYLKALLVWGGSVAFFMGWLYAVTWCFLPTTTHDKYKDLQ